MQRLSLGDALRLATAQSREALDDVECVICKEVARGALECLRCRHVFCTDCIRRWRAQVNCCPLKCSPDPILLVTAVPRVRRAMSLLEVRCDRGCAGLFPLPLYLGHALDCGMAPCRNRESCTRAVRLWAAGRAGCGLACLPAEARALVDEKGRVAFDAQKTSSRFVFTGQNELWLDDQKREFASAYSKLSFLPGKHRFRVRFGRVEQHFKVGFAREDADGPAFCDSPLGFAFYSIGQTRCGSDESGFPAGRALSLGKSVCVELHLDSRARQMYVTDGKSAGETFWHSDFERHVDGPLRVAIAVVGSVVGLTIEYLPQEELALDMDN